MNDLPDAPATRAEQFAFLRAAHDGPSKWRRYCLSLTRQAPGLPAVHRTALGAAYAVPKEHRITDVSGLRRGMAVFYDDPTREGEAGHVTTMAGWKDGVITDDLADTRQWSSDALRPGGVDLVPGDLFTDRWGYRFLWGSTSLNGYDLPGYNLTPTPPPSIEEALNTAVTAIRKALREQREAGNAKVAEALARDLAELKETRRFQ